MPTPDVSEQKHSLTHPFLYASLSSDLEKGGSYGCVGILDKKSKTLELRKVDYVSGKNSSERYEIKRGQLSRQFQNGELFFFITPPSAGLRVDSYPSTVPAWMTGMIAHALSQFIAHREVLRDKFAPLYALVSLPEKEQITKLAKIIPNADSSQSEHWLHAFELIASMTSKSNPLIRLVNDYMDYVKSPKGLAEFDAKTGAEKRGVEYRPRYTFEEWRKQNRPAAAEEKEAGVALESPVEIITRIKKEIEKEDSKVAPVTTDLKVKYKIKGKPRLTSETIKNLYQCIRNDDGTYLDSDDPNQAVSLLQELRNLASNPSADCNPDQIKFCTSFSSPEKTALKVIEESIRVALPKARAKGKLDQATPPVFVRIHGLCKERLEANESKEEEDANALLQMKELAREDRKKPSGEHYTKTELSFLCVLKHMNIRNLKIVVPDVEVVGPEEANRDVVGPNQDCTLHSKMQ